MIVIISAPDDGHTQTVLRALTDQGARDVRVLNLAEFPLQMAMNLRIDRERSDFDLVCADGSTIRMNEACAVWWRRPQPFGLPSDMAPVDRQFAQNEAMTAFHGIWQASSALWVNRVSQDAAAHHKPWQLALAAQIGLAIPETLITNSPDEARGFWSRHPGQIIYKPFAATGEAWRETRLLKQEEQAFADAIRLAPVIFQKYVPAVFDLRITIIGSRVFAAEAHLQNAEYTVDVRYNSDVVYKAHALPDDVTCKLLLLMRALGLEYGAIDMRLTPEGEYVFLEINPAGQFLYVELAAGIPIAAALAAHLREGKPTVEPEPPRIHTRLRPEPA